MLLVVLADTVKVPVTFRTPVELPESVPPERVRFPLTFVVRACPQLATPLIVRLVQAPELPFMVTVSPERMVTLSAACGVVPPHDVHVPAVPQLPPPVPFDWQLLA